MARYAAGDRSPAVRAAPAREAVVHASDVRAANARAAVGRAETARLERIRAEMQSDGVIHRLVETFKALGDPTRARIVFALSRDELRVGDIADLLDVSPSAVSHQLRVLRNMNLVRYRRQGKMAYYSLDDEHIENLFKEGLRHVRTK